MELTLQSMKTLSDLIDQALALEGDARTRWLDELSSGPHSSLSPIVHEMLSKHSEMSTRFLSHPPRIDGLAQVETVAAALPKLEPSARVGAYTLLRELGRGGMGVVWLAERSDGQLKRQVALKLPMLSASDALAERFVRERNILSQLEHPNIARLYDAGVTAAGQPYLALEYVLGEAITVHCDRKQLGVNERLQRFLDVARAVQYAHSNLIVHRDLKPSNILVTEEGAVRLLDFGIAKLLDESQSEAHETELTLMSGRALTLDYASPEQVQGSAIGIASDVYSLGVILYQLLCGCKPYSIGRENKFNAQKVLLEIEVIAPSKRAKYEYVVDSIDANQSNLIGANTLADARAEARQTSPQRLARALAGDLDTIVAKAMRKAPAERYGTVAEFAADIERYLRGLPVLAQPESWRYRAGKFIRRNRVSAGASAAVACSVVTGLGIALWQASVARDAATRADQEARIARAEKTRAEAEKVRADQEAVAARRESERADGEALAAQRAVVESKLQAARADGQSLAARREASRADREAKAATAQAQRATAVQAFLTDLFKANTSDQREALRVRSLTAPQLLDRGVEKLTRASDIPNDLSSELYRLFGTLYSSLDENARAVQMLERALVANEARHGKRSIEYATTQLELGWAAGEQHLGSRLDLIESARSFLAVQAPNSELLARAYAYEAQNTLVRDQPRALVASQQALRILAQLGVSDKVQAIAQRTQAHALRMKGDHRGAIDAYAKAAQLFATLYGADNIEVGESKGGMSASLRMQLKLDQAHGSVSEAVEILRPFDGALTDAKAFGRGAMLLTAEIGETTEALKRLDTAYARLPRSEGRPHRLDFTLAVAQTNVALMRADYESALKFVSRATKEYDGKTPSTIAELYSLKTQSALGKGDTMLATESVELLRPILQSEKLPLMVSLAAHNALADYEAMRGNFGEAKAVLQRLDAAQPNWREVPLARLLVELTQARVGYRSGDYVGVLQIADRWLKQSQHQLPKHAHGELALLAAEASIQLGTADSKFWSAMAHTTLIANDAPSSARLQRIAQIHQVAK